MKKRNSTLLKARMSGYWFQAFNALAPALSLAVDKCPDSVPCPLAEGTDGFRLFQDANETGGGVKHAERVFPEGIDLLMWVNRWSFVEAYDALADFLGDDALSTPVPPKSKALPNPKPPVKNNGPLRQWLNFIWQQAVPLTDKQAEPARLYFQSRGILEASLGASNIKYHPRLPYKDKDGNVIGMFGAILSLVSNNQDKPVSIHRTYLTEKGEKIALNQHKAKKLTPPVDKTVKGRQVRLYPHQDGVLGVSEGLETALAVIQARGIPVWPNLASTMLQSFEPPKDVHTVLNFVDKDRLKKGKRAGDVAADILTERLSEKGIRVINLLPPTPILETDEKGVDWADQWLRDPDGFREVDEVLAYLNRKSA